MAYVKKGYVFKISYEMAQTAHENMKRGSTRTAEAARIGVCRESLRDAMRRFGIEKHSKISKEKADKKEEAKSEKRFRGENVTPPTVIRAREPTPMKRCPGKPPVWGTPGINAQPCKNEIPITWVACDECYHFSLTARPRLRENYQHIDYEVKPK